MNNLLQLQSPSFIWMETVMDFVIIWLMMFLPIILFKIIYLRLKGSKKAKDSMVFTEAIGFPLTFLQPIVFFMAFVGLDWLGMALTLFWGPGFLIIVGMVLWSLATKRRLNWGNSGVYISWLCKLYYVVYVVAAFSWDMPKLLFALSAWIASDQIEKSFASSDADRARRTFHDYWLIRFSYPLFLFTPFFFGLNDIFKVYGVVLFALWVSGVLYVARKGQFFVLPDDPTLLRNMVYFSKDSVRRGS